MGAAALLGVVTPFCSCSAVPLFIGFVEAGIPIGVVTSIQGLRWFTVRVAGQTAHAGTTPRASRRDALVAAVAMVRALGELMADLKIKPGPESASALQSIEKAKPAMEQFAQWFLTNCGHIHPGEQAPGECSAIEQAIERAGTKAGNKGIDAALAAIQMANVLRQLEQ